MFAAFQKYLDGPTDLIYEPQVTKIEIQEASI